MRSLSFLFLAIFVFGVAGAQEVKETENENEKKFLDHYVGLQVNEFIRQLLNITSTSFTHPYYLNYALNHHESGWGINLGFGYDYGKTREGDAITEINNELNQLSLRIGPEKKFYLGKRLVLAAGIDFLKSDESNKSEVIIHAEDDQFTKTTVENVIRGQGLGARFAVSFRFSKWFLLGSEASYYYLLSKTSQTVHEEVFFISNESENYEEDNFEERSLEFNTPVALFAIFSF